MADTDEIWTAEEGSVYLRIPQSSIYKLVQEKVSPVSSWEGTGGFTERQFFNGLLPAKIKNLNHHPVAQSKNTQ